MDNTTVRATKCGHKLEKKFTSLEETWAYMVALWCCIELESLGGGGLLKWNFFFLTLNPNPKGLASS